jgi:hypothetical protein
MALLFSWHSFLESILAQQLIFSQNFAEKIKKVLHVQGVGISDKCCAQIGGYLVLVLTSLTARCH